MSYEPSSRSSNREPEPKLFAVSSELQEVMLILQELDIKKQILNKSKGDLEKAQNEYDQAVEKFYKSLEGIDPEMKELITRMAKHLETSKTYGR